MKTLYVVLTNKCTLSCKYCFYNAGLSSKNACDLKAVKILDKIKDFSKYFDNILFTGGESLLSEDIFQLASECKKYNLKTSIITNGTLLTEEICKKICSTFDKVAISLDSLDPKLNDLTRGKFSSVKKGLDMLLKIRPVNLEIEILQTISAVNYKSIDEMIKFCNDENIKLWLQPVDLNVNSASYGLLSLKLLNKEKLDEFKTNLRKWIKFKSSGDRKEEKALNGFLDNINNLIKDKTIKVKCKMGIDNFVLEPDGNIYSCFSRKDLFFGNIYQTDLSVIMDKSKDVFKKKKLTTTCARLGCLCLTDF